MNDTVVPLFFPKRHLQFLINQLRERNYRVVGPTVDQNAIVYQDLQSVDQLPQGWKDEQSPGQYRLARREDDRWFGFSVGPHSWKKYLFPSRETVLQAEPGPDGWIFLEPALDLTRFALLGVRACEIAAIRVQDQVFLANSAQDQGYRQRREGLFIVAVNCAQAAATCFCTSFNTGPRCRQDYDLALTEIEAGFVCEIGSEIGQEVINAIDPIQATAEQLDEADHERQQAVEQMTRQLDVSDLPGLLSSNPSHPRWQQVGERCLSCTNCTMVCPTCFCSSVTEVRDLNTEHVQRERYWDSCFNPEFSYCAGAIVRQDTASRYRQWLTHKLDSWHSQFGTSGCVGCGRCITWCPVGIDLTEEVAAIRQDCAP